MQLRNNLFVVDVETTGPNPFTHELLAVALVPVHAPEQSLSIYVRSPLQSWTNFALTNFRKFDAEWNQQALDPIQAVARISEYFDKFLPTDTATLVGHNVGFDLSFLKKLALFAGLADLPRISHRSIDTHTLLYLAVLQGALPEKTLSSEAAFEALGISPPSHQRHTAIGDAMATRLLFLRLLDLLEPLEKHTLRRSVR